MKPKIYGIRNCDTMKKAFAWLEAGRIAYDFHDYKKDGVPPGKLKEWAARAGWEKLANTRGPTWRKIPDAEKAGLTEARAVALLAKNPSAIKRPILEAGSTLLVGFDETQYAAHYSKGLAGQEGRSITMTMQGRRPC
jgi:Spx/MgsR family transcriptional regulator